MTDHASLRADLEQMSSGFRRLGVGPGGWLREEFVLRMGIDCIAQALPPHFRPGFPKRCFHNAQRLAGRWHRLRYCEGFVGHDRLPFPIHHAWTIDADDRVIDPTLPAPAEHVYIGVALTRAEYRAALPKGSTSVLVVPFDTIECVNADWMLARCPALRELMKEAA